MSTPYNRQSLSLSTINSDNENTPFLQGQGPSPGRAALSPKSANIQNVFTNANNDKDKDQIFQLQIEIQSLKNRLKLSSSANKNELIDLIAEKETVIQSKSKQIQVLNEKFHKITKAVAQMEREVSLLRKDNSDMESDNKKLKRHLNIREKEVTALVTRCTAQEEKLAESKSSRVLDKQLSEVKAKLVQSEEQLNEMEAIHQRMVQSEKERDAAMTQIDRLRSDKENLSSHINETKEQFDTQLRSRDEALAKLEKEVDEFQDLKKKQEAECARLNQNLNECDMRMNEMKQAVQELKKAHAEQVHDLERQLKEQEAQSTQQQYESVSTLRAEKDEEIQELKLQLKTGDQAMANVLKDVATLRRENDQVYSDLEQVKTERDELVETGGKNAELHEKEVSHLTDALDATTEEIQQLTKIVSELKENNTCTAGEAIRLNDKITSLEDEIANMTEREEKMMEAEKVAADTISQLQGNIRVTEEVSCVFRYGEGKCPSVFVNLIPSFQS